MSIVPGNMSVDIPAAKRSPTPGTRCAALAANASVLVNIKANLLPLPIMPKRMVGSIIPTAICCRTGRSRNISMYLYSSSIICDGSLKRSPIISIRSGLNSPLCMSEESVCHPASAKASSGLVPTSRAFKALRVNTESKSVGISPSGMRPSVVPYMSLKLSIKSFFRTSGESAYHDSCTSRCSCAGSGKNPAQGMKVCAI